MRLFNGKIRYPIAEEIFPLMVHFRLRENLNPSVHAALRRQAAGEGVRLVVAQGYRLTITILCRMTDPVPVSLNIHKLLRQVGLTKITQGDRVGKRVQQLTKPR